MKKFKISVALLLLAGGSLLFSGCIGNFRLTNSVLDWNKNVGNKFVNELVFIAFWILPVYEVTAVADLLVLNSIEFWSGSNPVASTRTIDTENGKYIVDSKPSGYVITHEPTGRELRLDYDTESQTWSLEKEEGLMPFMTFVDDSHVKMITPEGDFRLVELSEQGVMAYTDAMRSSDDDLNLASR